jgi:hypothetical protein
VNEANSEGMPIGARRSKRRGRGVCTGLYASRENGRHYNRVFYSNGRKIGSSMPGCGGSESTEASDFPDCQNRCHFWFLILHSKKASNW